MKPLNTTSVYVFWKDKVLLIQRSPKDSNLPLYWESPAGHVDVLCYPIDSALTRREALRELREETGITANAKDLTFLPRLSNDSHLTYSLTLNPNLIPKVKLSFEHVRFMWINPYRHKLPDNTREEVKKAFAGIS